MSTTDMSSNNNSTASSADATANNNNMEEGAHHVSTLSNTASTITTPINTIPNTHDDALAYNSSNNTAPIYPAVSNNISVSIARYDSSFNDDDDSESNESSSVENDDVLYTTPVKSVDSSDGGGEDRKDGVVSSSSKEGVVSEHTIKLTRDIEELGSLGKKKAIALKTEKDCGTPSSLDVKPTLLKTKEIDNSSINAAKAKKQDDETPYTPTKKSTAITTHYPFKKSSKQPQSKQSSLPKNKSIPLHTLPTDALHTTSSYCTPTDWAALCSTNSIWKNIGKDIFGKVWRHAGLCMLEIGYAWVRILYCCIVCLLFFFVCGVVLIVLWEFGMGVCFL